MIKLSDCLVCKYHESIHGRHVRCTKDPTMTLNIPIAVSGNLRVHCDQHIISVDNFVNP